MALPNTGPLSLNSIRTELSASSINVSLRSLSNTAGFTIPDTISEFYGYSDGSTEPPNNSVPLGLTSPIHSENLSSSNNYSLRSHTISSDYVGYYVRVVWEYTNGTSGTSFRGDFQLDDMNLFGTSFDPEDGISSGWQTSTNNTSSFDSVSFTNLATGTSGGRWNRDDFGTPSSGTGIAGGNTGNNYYYAETSGSSTNGHKYWLRSPEITITSNNLVISYYIGHLGDNVGDYKVYLEVIS